MTCFSSQSFFFPVEKCIKDSNSKIILNKTVAVIWPYLGWAFSHAKGSCSLSLDFLIIDSVRLTFSSNKVWPMTSFYLQWLRFGFWVFWGQVFFRKILGVQGKGTFLIYSLPKLAIIQCISYGIVESITYKTCFGGFRFLYFLWTTRYALKVVLFQYQERHCLQQACYSYGARVWEERSNQKYFCTNIFQINHEKSHKVPFWYHQQFYDNFWKYGHNSSQTG